MGQAIVKQPNGKLALYSTVSGDFELINATWHEIAAYRISVEAERILMRLEQSKEKVEAKGSDSMAGRTWESIQADLKERDPEAWAVNEKEGRT